MSRKASPKMTKAVVISCLGDNCSCETYWENSFEVDLHGVYQGEGKSGKCRPEIRQGLCRGVLGKVRGLTEANKPNLAGRFAEFGAAIGFLVASDAAGGLTGLGSGVAGRLLFLTFCLTGWDSLSVSVNCLAVLIPECTRFEASGLTVAVLGTFTSGLDCFAAMRLCISNADFLRASSLARLSASTFLLDSAVVFETSLLLSLEPADIVKRIRQLSIFKNSRLQEICVCPDSSVDDQNILCCQKSSQGLLWSKSDRKKYSGALYHIFIQDTSIKLADNMENQSLRKWQHSLGSHPMAGMQTS